MSLSEYLGAVAAIVFCTSSIVHAGPSKVSKEQGDKLLGIAIVLAVAAVLVAVVQR